MKISARKRTYKKFTYNYSPVRKCWKIYNLDEGSYLLKDFESEKETKKWIIDKGLSQLEYWDL